MTAKDYGKPIGWWCPECARQGNGEEDIAVGQYDSEDTMFEIHNMERPIPVFAVIPEGERPTTHEPTRDTVCVDDTGDLMQPLNANDERRRWAWKTSDGTWRLVNNWRCVSRGRTYAAAAILWVAEGKR